MNKPQLVGWVLAVWLGARSLGRDLNTQEPEFQ